MDPRLCVCGVPSFSLFHQRLTAATTVGIILLPGRWLFPRGKYPSRSLLPWEALVPGRQLICSQGEVCCIHLQTEDLG